MPLPQQQKSILWVSKEPPPMVLGAHFDLYTSGRLAVRQWKDFNYACVLVESGVLSDGYTGFDVVRNIRALNNRAVMYLLSNSSSGPESMLAQQLKVNGLIRKTHGAIQDALRQSNAINWADRPGSSTTPSLTKRFLNMFIPYAEKTESVPSLTKTAPQLKSLALQAVTPIHQVRIGISELIHDETYKPDTEKETENIDDVLSSLIELDLKIADDTTNSLTNEYYLAGLSNMNTSPTPSSFPSVRPRTTTMTHQIKNPHDIKLLNFSKLGDDYEEADRQFAWELYTELSTRVAVTGKANDSTCTNTEGELWVESFSSLLAFCKELRVLLRTFPARDAKGVEHLGGLLVNITRIVLNPFLDKWRVDYLHWWEYNSDKSKPPSERQLQYPRSQEMLVEWRELKMTLRAVQDTVGKVYKL